MFGCATAEDGEPVWSSVMGSWLRLGGSHRIVVTGVCVVSVFCVQGGKRTRRPAAKLPWWVEKRIRCANRSQLSSAWHGHSHFECWTQAKGNEATIGGGTYNTANKNYATVAGGRYNTAGGVGSMVAGGAYTSGGGQHNYVAGGYGKHFCESTWR